MESRDRFTVEPQRPMSSEKLDKKELDKRVLTQEEIPVGTQAKKVSLREDNPVSGRFQKYGRTINIAHDSEYSRKGRRRSTFQDVDIKAILQRHRKSSQAKKQTVKKEGLEQIKMQSNRTPLEVFKKAVRMVVILTRAFRSIFRFAAEKGGHAAITDETTLSLKSTAGVRGIGEQLLFDPAAYRCHYQVMLPLWARRIMNRGPCNRREKDVWALVHLLKQLKGFRRYSSDTQFAICKAIKYDCFNRRRVVIRKGHVAQRFYFIYSGAVCVTFDNYYAAFNQPEDNDKSILKKGDHFGELAFIRNLNRAATIVCLEETELLSVDKEDFFKSGIDKSFHKEMEDRINFLCSRPVLSSWPEDTVRKLAQESKLQDYHSGEVVVKDSTASPWLVFIVKGQAEVLRLLDLSSCKEYAKHCQKYRKKAIEEPVERCVSPSNRISPSSITSSGFSRSRQTADNKDSNNIIPSTASESRILSKQNREVRDEVASHVRTKSAVPVLAQKTKPLIRFLSTGNWRREQTTFNIQKGNSGNRNSDPVQSERLPVELIKEEPMLEQIVNCQTPKKYKGKCRSDETGVGVYMRLDRLEPGDCFGLWSLGDFAKGKKKKRRFHLLSMGCEVIKVSKEMFFKHSDELTMERLKEYVKVYPSDSTLCTMYLKQSDWKTYREELVENLVINNIAKMETAKGSARGHLVRASPVPPPLCTVRPWQASNDKWEYFPNVGWAATQVATPAIEAGKPCRTKEQRVIRNIRSDRVRKGSISPVKTADQTRQTEARVSRHTPKDSSSSLSLEPQKESFKLTKTNDSLRVLPIVRNEEVLAKGSHRNLILTHGGRRVNDRQIKVEKRLLKHGPHKPFNLYSSKVS